MSFTNNFLKALREKGVNTTMDTDSAKPSVSSGNNSTGTESNTFTSNFLAALESKKNKTISEKVETRVRQLKERGQSDGILGAANNNASRAVRNAAGNAIENARRGRRSAGYYSRPNLGSANEKLRGNVTALESIVTEKRTALDATQDSLHQAENELKTVQGYLDQAKATYDANPTDESASKYNDIVGAFNLAYKSYASAYDAYSNAYNEYKPYENELVDAMAAYQLYADQQQAAFDNWRDSIRDTETIKRDLDSADAEIGTLESRISSLKSLTRFRNDALGQSMKQSLAEAQIKLEELQAERDLLQEEYDWSQHYMYSDLAQADDFAEKSKYVSTANGLEPVLNNFSGMYTQTGFDDLTYDYINRNEEARGRATVNSIGDNSAFLGLDKSYLEKMTDDEIAIFNYLYATQGSDAAYQYTAYLTGDLTRRQRMEQEEQWATWAAESPVKSSAFSALMSPVKGLSYIGQMADYASDGQIDQNAAYNKFSYIPSSIRSEVVRQIEESGKWGKVGSFAYQTGMSMADFLLASALTGNNQAITLTIMGSGAAADTVMAAKDRGLGDDQAFTLGTIAGLAEAGMESVNMETVFKPDLLKEGVLKYILKNAAAEGMEEVGTDVVNLLADILVSKDQSEWQISIDNYMSQGMTEAEAVARALGDQALIMAADFTGGAFSGGILSGTNAGIHVNYTNRMGTELGELDLDEDEIQTFIETGLESDPETASYHLAVEMQAKIEAGEALSNYDLARLYQANVQAQPEAEWTRQEEPDNLSEAIAGQWEGEDGDGEVSAEALLTQAKADLKAGKITDAEFDTIMDDVMHLEELEDGTSVKTSDSQDSVNAWSDNVNPQADNVNTRIDNRNVQTDNVNANVNGGTQYGSTNERAAGPAIAQPAGGLYVPGEDSLLPGGSQRNDGTGAGKQTGSLAGRTGAAAQRRGLTVDQLRTQNQRNALGTNLRLEKVSSISLGVASGTDTPNLQVIPQENWDQGMMEKAQQIQEETGKQIRYVLGKIQVRGAGGGAVNVKGVITDGGIIVQANNAAFTAEQIADHEGYHGLVDKYGQSLNENLIRRIRERFTEEEFDRVVDQYMLALRETIDPMGAETGEEYERRVNLVMEEVLADARAGMNAFGAGADRFTQTINQFLEESGLSWDMSQENGTEEPTGPPSDRYSYAGENANNADLDALARAKEMRSAGVADEIIRQQTGWHTGMDGKWRWEIDDSAMRYDSSGDLRGAESAKWAMEDYESARDDLWGHADMGTLEKVRAYNRADIAGDDATKQELYDELINGQYAYYFDQYAEAMTRAQGARNAPAGGTLQDYIDHPALFEAYPQLRNVTLRFERMGGGMMGYYSRTDNEIVLNTELRYAAEDTLVHEIQHAIQKAEGFTRGSNEEYWKHRQDGDDAVHVYDAKIQESEKKMDEIMRQLPENVAEQFRQWSAMDESSPEAMALMQELWGSPYNDLFEDYWFLNFGLDDMRRTNHKRGYRDLYRNTAGEIEARDAASRRQLTAEQRRSTEPAGADDRTVFVEGIDDATFAELDAQYGPQLQSAADFDQDTISSNIQQVAQMEPVTSISGQEFAKGEVDLITQVETFFNQRGNRAYSPELGEVILDRKGVKSDIAHGIGRKKAAAFAAVPDVIEHGLVVDYQKDWKGRGYDTAVVAAPITIGDQTHAAAVILLRSDQTNRFYVHEVLAMENGALPFKTGTREGYPGGDAPSILSILDKIRSVKNGAGSQERFSVDDLDNKAVIGDLQAELYQLQHQRRSLLEADTAYAAAADNLRYANTFTEKVKARKAMAAAAANIDTAAIDQRISDLNEQISEIRNRETRQHREDQEKYSGTKTTGYSTMPDTRLKNLDQDYMKAVQSGDRARMAELVEQAAEAAMPASVVRDKSGRLLKTYHHTGSRFTVFDRNMARTGTEMDGFFFAPDPDSTSEYGSNMITAYLNITKLAMDPKLDRKFNDSGTLLREKLAYQGYDGMARTENGEIYEYMTFDPEQIKSADPVVYDDRGRVVPLSKRFDFHNPDIRYSADASGANELRENMTTKEREILRGVETRLLRNIGGALSVTKFGDRSYLKSVIQGLSDTYLESGTIEQQAMDDLFEQAYRQGIVVDRELHDQYEEVRKHLHTVSLTLDPRDRSDITDYPDFVKRMRGRMRIVNEGGLPVDIAWQELNDMAPELFPDSIAHPADQLVRMTEVLESLRITEKSLNDYYGPMAATYKKDAKAEFERAVWESIGELRQIRRFEQERQQKLQDAEPAPTTPEEAMEAWTKLKTARKTYEKAMAKNLLTTEDEIAVGELLKGKMLPEHLDKDNLNVKGILAVYEAKQEYEHLTKLLAEYRRKVKADIRTEADTYLETANTWKDKEIGLLYSREIMQRNVEDIVPDKKLAKQINERYFEPVRDAEAAAVKMKEEYREAVRKLNLSRNIKKGNLVSEAHAVQLYGEAMDNIRMLEKVRGRLKHRDGKSLEEWRGVVYKLWQENPGLDKTKIENAVAEMRRIYDELFQKMNEVRVRWGYEPVNYRQGYFPHFQPGNGDGIMAQFGRALGIDTQVVALPTTINGLTHTFKPGIQWFGNAQERLGFNTAYDAVEGFDRYIEGVASVICQTENIQRLRALASQIRYRTGDEGIRKQVDAIYSNAALTEEQKNDAISGIYEKGRYTLSNFVVEVDEYTNLLANKKSKLDRTVEALIGRKFYTAMKWLESRVGANMIAGNVTSALTNFIPLTQASAQLSKKAMLQGMWDTLVSYKTDDGIVDRSSFLTNRRGSDPLVKVWSAKVSEVLGKPMELIDSFTSGSIVRAAYHQNLKQGLSESEAMHQADIFASRVMAERSKGGMPTLFESKNPFFKLFTQFQLEVNNQWSEVFKDIPRSQREKGLGALALVFLQYFLGAWLFNNLYEKWIGRRPAMDPIDIVLDTVKDFASDDVSATDALGNLANNVLEELPFSSALTLVGIETDGGRVPVSSGIPNIPTLVNAATNEDWAPEKRWKEAQDELNKLAYVIPPFGGNQVSKIWKGIKAYIEGGSYSVDSDGNDILQYPVYNDESGDFWGLVQAMLLGKSALPEAKEWVEDGFDSLSAKQTAIYQDMIDSGVSEREAYDLIDSLRSATETDEVSKKEAQIRILQDAAASDECKAIAFYGLLATDNERLLMDSLTDSGAMPGTVMDVLIQLRDAAALPSAKEKVAQADTLIRSALTESEKEIVICSWLDDQEVNENGNLTSLGKFNLAMKQGITTEEYLRFRATGMEIDKLLEYTEAGFEADEAQELAQAIHNLDPLPGEDRVSTLQKWRASVDFSDDVEDQLTALSMIMEPKSLAVWETANNYGVAPDVYVTFQEIATRYDANGNGSYTQAEAKAAIDAEFSHLTTAQKAVLWQWVCYSSGSKKNPYDPTVGQNFIDSRDAAKAASEE